MRRRRVQLSPADPTIQQRRREADDDPISTDEGGGEDDTLGAATGSLERKGMASSKRAKYHVRIRRFLNRDPQYPAFIIGVVEDTSGIPDDDADQSWNWGDIQLDLGDCYRRVSFDFPMGTPEERADSLYKINQIAETINAVRAAIGKEARSRDTRPCRKSEK